MTVGAGLPPAAVAAGGRELWEAPGGCRWPSLLSYHILGFFLHADNLALAVFTFLGRLLCVSLFLP